MKYCLVLLFGLSYVAQSFSQSSLYQNSAQRVLDEQRNFLEEHLFSTSFYEHSRLLTNPLPSPLQEEAALGRAISSLQLDRADGEGLMKQFLRDYPNHPKASEAAFYLGDYFFYSKNYREATSAYTLAKPSSFSREERADLLFKLGFSYFVLKEYAASSTYLDQVKNLSFPNAADALYYSAWIAMEQGNTALAISDLQQAEKSPYYAAKVPHLITALYYQLGDYQKAIGYALPLVNNNVALDRLETIHLFLAEAYYASKDFLNAAFHYKKVIQEKGRELTREEQYKAGIALFEIGEYPQATTFLKEVALGNDLIAQSASFYLGHAYLNLERFPLSSSSFQAAASLSIDPKLQEEARFNLAKVNLYRGNFQLAISALDDYLDTYPRGARVVEAESLLSDALLNSSDYLRALAQMDGLRNKSPRIQQAYQKVAYYQAIIYYRDNKWEDAVLMLNKSQRFPVDPDLLAETHFWKGEIYSTEEKWEEAIAAYMAVQREANPNHLYLLKAYFGLGYAYYNSQAYAQAEQSFQVFVNQSKGASVPNYDDAVLRLGDCQLVQKKFAEAKITFLQAIEDKNKSQDYAHYRLATINNYLGKNLEALQELTVLERDFPSSVYIEDGLYQRGQIFLEELRYQDAANAFTELIQKRPNSPLLPFALEGRAVSNFSLKKYEETVKDYKLILNDYPAADNAENALKGLQETLALQDKSEEFGEYLKAYQIANPNAGSVQFLAYETAKSLYFGKKYLQAGKALEEYLTTYPSSSQTYEATFFAGDAFYQAGELDKAFNFFKLFETYPAAPQRNRAFQNLGKIELSKGRYAEAKHYFELVLPEVRSKLEEAEVRQGSMLAHFGLKAYEPAILAAEKLLSLDGVLMGSTSKALLIKGKSHRELNQLELASSTLLKLVQEYPTEEGAEGLMILAEIQRDKKDFTGANELIFTYSSAFSSYEFWYGSMFIFLAENYIQLGEVFQAKATLQSVLEQASDATVKQRAASLLETLQ